MGLRVVLIKIKIIQARIWIAKIIVILYANGVLGGKDLLVNEPHGSHDGRDLDKLSDEEVEVHVSVQIRCVESLSVVDHCVQSPVTATLHGYYITDNSVEYTVGKFSHERKSNV